MRTSWLAARWKMEISWLTFNDPVHSLRQFLGLTVVIIEYMASLHSIEPVSVSFDQRVESVPALVRLLSGIETP
jgi:hypothetical protein